MTQRNRRTIDMMREYQNIRVWLSNREMPIEYEYNHPLEFEDEPETVEEPLAIPELWIGISAKTQNYFAEEIDRFA